MTSATDLDLGRDPLGPVGREAMRRSLPPFDLPDLDDPGAAGAARHAFADVDVSIHVIIDERRVVEHAFDFRGGALVRRTTVALVVDAAGRHEFGHRHCALGLTWPTYLHWRTGQLGFAEAVVQDGFVRGPFAAVALAQGLLQLPQFLLAVPVVAPGVREETMALISGRAC